MKGTQYRIFIEPDSESDSEYANIIEEEGFEEDPEGFEGLQKGSEIDQGGTCGPGPWDPSESFFAYI